MRRWLFVPSAWVGGLAVSWLAIAACSDDGATTPTPPRGDASVFDDGAITPTSACKAETSAGAVQTPTFVRNLKAGETAWFSSPAIVDLDGDGKMEIVAPLYSTFVFDANGKQLAKGTATKGRVYAPGVVADLAEIGRASGRERV